MQTIKMDGVTMDLISEIRNAIRRFRHAVHREEIRNHP